ncbi:MAG: hypothetical protein CO129_03300 [Ignavibacteriales bacterium CG_4_9_14_3_um_filter_34_10]|nr:MAG: hypothetical protein CO129_03300 [Ignavibacteriales bacterium CG_4_9_14_3_um_filter_34_10]
MKKILILFFPIIIYSQVGYVESGHPIYDFFDRAYSLQIINDYNSFEKPFPRNEISNILQTLNRNRSKLNPIDQRLLDKYLIEFEYDIFTSTNNSSNLITSGFSQDLIDSTEKYIYFYTDNSKFNLFAHALFSSEYYSKSLNNINQNVSLINYGLMFHGAFAENFGYYFKATNGTYFGDKNLAREKPELRYNFKFSKEEELNSGQNYFDFTEGFLSYQNDLISFKIGRDRENIGYGKIKTVLGNNAPPFDYFNFRLKYKSFAFSYMHGKLLGNSNIIIDSMQGLINNIEDKYFVYHKFSFNPSRDFNFGLGEIIIYSNRSLDFSYLNPLNFYKSIEHSNQDRDNSILFFDFRNNSIRGVTLFSSLFIDDLDFGKLGTNWYGNRFLFELGSIVTSFYQIIPMTFSFQYIRIDPYFYSHHVSSNNLSNLGYLISNSFQPNSSIISSDFSMQVTDDIFISAGFKYAIHGSNIYNANGKLIINNGGNFAEGFRIGDDDYVSSLSGEKEFIREYNFSLSYEIANNYFINLVILKNNSDLKFKPDNKATYFSTQISLKL